MKAIISKHHLRLAFIIVVVTASLSFLFMVKNGLYPFIIAFFLAYLLNPAVCYLESKGIKRLTAILLVYAVVFSLLLYCGSMLVPVILRELEGFSQDLPSLVEAVESQLQSMQNQYQNSALPYSLRLTIDQRLGYLQLEGQSFVASLADALMGLLTHAIGLVITPVLAFYLLCDWYLFKEKFLHIVPARWRHEINMVWKDLDKVLSGVIRGQVTVAVIVGVLVSSGLYLLHVRYALIIGILAGVLDLIPYFGAIIGATPAVILALLVSPYLALKVIILFFVIHQVEGTIIGPKILGESAGLHPLSVIFFVFVGSEVGGLAGMLLSVPVAAIGKVLLQHLVKHLI